MSTSRHEPHRSELAPRSVLDVADGRPRVTFPEEEHPARMRKARTAGSRAADCGRIGDVMSADANGRVVLAIGRR